MKSLFDEVAFEEIHNRFHHLNTSTKPKWGKMNAGQMVYHCQGPLNIILGKNHYGMKPSFFFRLFKKSMYSDKPWRKSLPTSKPFRVLSDKNFETERKKLLELVQELYDQRGKEVWDPHPALGNFTRDQWGKMQYKHLDHHLRQFGL